MTFNKGHNMRYLSPNSDGGGGNSGGAGEPGIPAGAPAEGAGEAGSAPQYVSRQDFDSFASRFEETVSRLSAPKAEPKQESGKPEDPKDPDANLRDYNFNDPKIAEKEYLRYRADVRKFDRWLNNQELARENESKQAEETIKKTLTGHNSRVAEYRKAHPEFDSDLRTHGAAGLNDVPKNAVMRHKDSAAIAHYLIKNKPVAEELNALADSGDADDVKYRIGEIAASIRSESQVNKANADAAGKRPIPFSNRGTNTGGKTELSPAERVKRYKEKA